MSRSLVQFRIGCVLLAAIHFSFVLICHVSFAIWHASLFTPLRATTSQTVHFLRHSCHSVLFNVSVRNSCGIHFDFPNSHTHARTHISTTLITLASAYFWNDPIKPINKNEQHLGWSHPCPANPIFSRIPPISSSTAWRWRDAAKTLLMIASGLCRASFRSQIWIGQRAEHAVFVDLVRYGKRKIPPIGTFNL